MGHAEVTALHDVIARYWWQRGYEVMNPIGWDSFGLPAENAAIQRNEHPATYTYANIETQAASFKKYAVSLRLVPPAAHLRPGVLPLDAVAVPEAARARPGLPQVQPGQLVPQRPDRAGQRAGRRRVLRALRRRGDQARADPVVLQGHRLRPAAAGRHGRPGLARAGADPAAQLDRPLRGCARRLRGRPPGRPSASTTVSVYTTRPDTLFGATFMVVAADAKLAAEIVHRRTSATAYEAYLAETRKASDIDRMSTERPKTGVFLGAYAVNPVNGETRPGVGRRLRAGRLRHRRDHGGARPGPARLGLRRRPTTCRSCARSSRPRAGRARRSPVRGRRSTPPTRPCRWTAWRSTRPSARSSATWRSRGAVAGR